MAERHVGVQTTHAANTIPTRSASVTRQLSIIFHQQTLLAAAATEGLRWIGLGYIQLQHIPTGYIKLSGRHTHVSRMPSALRCSSTDCRAPFTNVGASLNFVVLCNRADHYIFAL